MAGKLLDIGEFHWLMDMLQSIDAGLVVLDREYRVQIWNGFMENNSGRRPPDVIGKPIFEVYPAIPQDWFRSKTESVFLLRARAFTSWEQRPYLFPFRSRRPITGSAEFMYQNVTLVPLTSLDGRIDHIGIIVYDVTETATGTAALEVANKQLEVLSRTDRLTQLNNRGYWEERLKEEFARVRRNRGPGTLALLDIDHFKQVNDRYGHQAGDDVLRHTSAMLRSVGRTTDIVGRYGGEEFGVILLDTKAEDACVFAERLRSRIEASRVRHGANEIGYTISLGIAEVTPDMHEYKQWIECSDQALYQSKQSGRNRTTVYHVD